MNGTTREPLGQASEEALLRSLFREFLPDGDFGDGFGDEDSFFQLGGDSITVLRLVSRARAEGLHLSIPDVFECRTVAVLAARARANRASTERRPDERDQGPFSLVPLSQEELDEFGTDIEPDGE